MAGLLAERHAEDNWELIEMDETRQYDVALAECRSYEDDYRRLTVLILSNLV